MKCIGQYWRHRRADLGIREGGGVERLGAFRRQGQPHFPSFAVVVVDQQGEAEAFAGVIVKASA